jgi:hypothetical protein
VGGDGRQVQASKLPSLWRLFDERALFVHRTDAASLWNFITKTSKTMRVGVFGDARAGYEIAPHPRNTRGFDVFED